MGFVSYRFSVFWLRARAQSVSIILLSHILRERILYFTDFVLGSWTRSLFALRIVGIVASPYRLLLESDLNPEILNFIYLSFNSI